MVDMVYAQHNAQTFPMSWKYVKQIVPVDALAPCGAKPLAVTVYNDSERHVF